MVFTKEEVLGNFPFKERLKLEKAKSQNSIVYWINELVASNFSGADDVPSLISFTKNVTEQLEALYEEKESSNSPDTSASVLEQLEGLYSEKEELYSHFPGVHSNQDLIEMVRDMEAQLSDLYKEKEKV
jgi:hypothetical protein